MCKVIGTDTYAVPGEHRMSQSTTDPLDTFTTQIESYGVNLLRVSSSDVESTIKECLEPPAVGVPLPWDDISLPEAVQTDATVADLRSAVTGVSPASFAIAEYGSLYLQANDDGSEPVSLFNDLHVAVLREEDILTDMEDAFERLGDELRETRGSGIIATGPSATADMGALVQGAHGPKEVTVVVVS